MVSTTFLLQIWIARTCIYINLFSAHKLTADLSNANPENCARFTFGAETCYVSRWESLFYHSYPVGFQRCHIIRDNPTLFKIQCNPYILGFFYSRMESFGNRPLWSNRGPTSELFYVQLTKQRVTGIKGALNSVRSGVKQWGCSLLTQTHVLCMR